MKRVGFLALAALVLTATVGVSAARADGDGPKVTPEMRLFLDYTYNISGYEDYDPRFDDNDTNSFNVTRTYLGLKAKLSDDWSARVTFDSRPGETVSYTTTTLPATTDTNGDGTVDANDEGTEVISGATSSRTDRPEVFVKFAYLTYQPIPEIGGTFGLQPSSHATVYKLWKHRYIRNEAMFEHGMVRTGPSDTGVAVHGSFPKGFGGWKAGVFNGEGVGRQEANSGKHAQAAAYVNALAGVKDAGELNIMGMAGYGKVETNHPDVVDTYYGGILNYAYPFSDSMSLALYGEYGMRTVEEELDGVDPVDSTVLAAWLEFQFCKQWGLLVYYDDFDPNTENDEGTGVGYQDEESTILAGIWYYPLKEIKFNLNYRATSYTAEIVDDNGDDVTKQADQFITLNTEVVF
ncbi:MAG: hypothetical protein H6684_12235 [Deltaproteobacteria bacterium]|nr:hypothetical protein [Deltaproteobacteria bacterium]